MNVDFGRRAQDYLRHRQGFPAVFYERIEAMYGLGRPGQRALDLGTGTGTVARRLAAQGCEVTAVDVSASMLEVAAEAAADEGLAVRLVERPARDTGLAAESFDLVVAGQCWHWFEREQAAAEAWRVLRPGGALVIVHLDWLLLPGSVFDATSRVLEDHARTQAWSPVFAHSRDGFYPQWLRDVHGAGFEAPETFSMDVTQRYTHAAWRGRIRASGGVAVMEKEEVERFDALHAEAIAPWPDPLDVPHRLFAVITTKPGETT